MSTKKKKRAVEKDEFNIDQSTYLITESRQTVIKQLKPSLMHVCYDYQRPFIRSSIKRLVTQFNILYLGIVLVGQRKNGTYWIVDGQHRWKAVDLLIQAGVLPENYTLQCKVFKSKGPVDEANVFWQINGFQKKPSKKAEFRARLKAGDKMCRDIMRTIKETGFELSFTSNVDYWPFLNCISMLEKIYKMKGNASLLKQVLDFSYRTWYEEKAAAKEKLIHGLACLFRSPLIYTKSKEKAVITEEDWFQFLETRSAAKWIRGYQDRFPEVVSGQSGNYFAKYILEKYNERKTAKAVQFPVLVTDELPKLG